MKIKETNKERRAQCTFDEIVDGDAPSHHGWPGGGKEGDGGGRDSGEASILSA